MFQLSSSGELFFGVRVLQLFLLKLKVFIKEQKVEKHWFNRTAFYLVMVRSFGGLSPGQTTLPHRSK